ncbi:hypothetical protein SMACR_06443 [Sordaria macrospora]|uniref:Uncharacterized protein n=1 Tax=Sordaria macrospora TaxID=5147 RepID=A0A8S8ZJK7_SORMA|nr:hypothetical protein SMACR_06443 [Sordaria macrospora]WPJ63058.1 hypothetical protein SMAC4_06443 [Sordaria macrospora]
MEQHDNLHPEGVDMSRVRRFWKIFHCHMCGGDVKTQLYCPSCGHPFCRSCQREVVAEENVTKVVTSSQALDPFRSVDPSPNTVKPPMPTGKPTKKNREPDPVPDERPGVSSSAASEATTANVQREAIGKRESVKSNRFVVADRDAKIITSDSRTSTAEPTLVSSTEASTLTQAGNASQELAGSHEAERRKTSSTVQNETGLTSPPKPKDRSSSHRHTFEEFNQAITKYSKGTPTQNVSSSVRNVRDTHSVSSEGTRGTLDPFSPSPVHPPLPPPIFLPPRTMSIDVRKTPDTSRWISPPKAVADVSPSPPLPAPHVHKMRPAQPAMARQFSAVKRQARKLANGPSSRASEEFPGPDVETIKSTSGSSGNTATRYYMPKVKVSSPPLWLKSPSTRTGGNVQRTRGSKPPAGSTRTGSLASTATTTNYITGDSGRTGVSVGSHAFKDTSASGTVINPYFPQLRQQEQRSVKQGEEDSGHGVHERQGEHGDYQHSGNFLEETTQYRHAQKINRKVSEDLKARILSLPVSEQVSKSSKGSRHPLQADSRSGNKAGLATVINRISEMQSDPTYSGRSVYSGRSTHSGHSTPSTIRSVVTTPKVRPGRTLTPISGKGAKSAGGNRRHSQNRTPTPITTHSSGSHSQRWLEQQQQYQLQQRSSRQSTRQPTGQRTKRSQAPSPVGAIDRPNHSDATGLSSLPSRSSGTSYQSCDIIFDRKERSSHRATTRRESETAPLLNSNVSSTSTAKTIGNRPPPKKAPTASSADIHDHRSGLRRVGQERTSSDDETPPNEGHHEHRSSSTPPPQEIVRQEEGTPKEEAGCHHDPGQGIQGLTIVLHLKGQEDLVISTDLTHEGSGADGATSVTISLSPIVPLSPQSPNSGHRVASPFRIL